MLRKKINFKLGGGSGGFLIPGVAIGLLGFLGVIALNPMILAGSDDVYADESTLVAYLSPSITLSMGPSVSENIEPTVDGSFKNLSTVVRVQVMNSDYYDISIRGDSDMVGQKNPDAKIVAVEGSRTAAEFANNTWGYSVSKNSVGGSATAPTENTTYAPMPTTSTAVAERQQTKNNAADDYYTLNFGAKVDTNIPADTYTSRVTLSVVATPSVVLLKGFGSIETMQQLTPAICREIGTEEDDSASQYEYTDSFGKKYWTKRLRDERDNKLYWVSKLADGNCWMTQNLALDIPDEGLTSELTALKPGTEKWVPIEGTRVVDDMTEAEKLERFKIAMCPSVDEGGVYGENKQYASERVCLDKNSQYSWDEGEYVLIYPGAGDALNSGLDAAWGGLSGYANKATVLAKFPKATAPVLTDYGVVLKVDSDWTAAVDQAFTKNSSYRNATGETVGKMAGWAVDPLNKVYDAHYLIGNYYQWLAATAQTIGDGNNVDTGDLVDGSICPSNWELPTTGNFYDEGGSVVVGSLGYDGGGVYVGYSDASGSFYKLFQPYAGNVVTDSYSNMSNHANIPGTSLTLENVFTGAPVHLLRSGFVIPSSNSRYVDYVGYTGDWWPSVARNEKGADAFRVQLQTSYFVNYDEFYYGNTVRCLVNAAD